MDSEVYWIATDQDDEDQSGKGGIFQDQFMFIQKDVEPPGFKYNQDKTSQCGKVRKVMKQGVQKTVKGNRTFGNRHRRRHDKCLTPKQQPYKPDHQVLNWKARSEKLYEHRSNPISLLKYLPSNCIFSAF